MTFGFPYPPLPLFEDAIAESIAGEPRLTHCVALAATLAILAGMRAGALAGVACALFAAMRDVAEVAFWSFTEPMMLPWLALTAWAMRTRRPLVAAACFGLFLSGKQYTVIFLPLLWFLIPPHATWRRAAGVAGVTFATAAAVTLPLALWDPRAFWFSTVTVQLVQPFRPDSLSFPALYAHWANDPSPPTPGFLALVPTYGIVFALARGRRRTPTMLAFSVACVAGVFFAFSKQAFANYYLLVQAALTIGLAHVASPDPAGQIRNAGPTAAAR